MLPIPPLQILSVEVEELTIIYSCSREVFQILGAMQFSSLQDAAWSVLKL